MSDVQASKGANIYELLRNFWRENEYEPFSTATIALYHFLIDRANSRRWRMPFSCPTEVVARAVGVSRQTIITARETLRSRGFIRYTAGSGKKSYSSYWLTLNLTECLTDNLTQDLTEVLTDSLTDNLAVDLTPLNIEDNNIKDKNINILNNKGEKKIFSLEELEIMMMKDEPWLTEILPNLNPKRDISITELQEYLKRFFLHVKSQGFKEREEKDCRQHFVNWMNRQPIKNNQNNKTIINVSKQSTESARRGTEVTATSPSEYEGSF